MDGWRTYWPVNGWVAPIGPHRFAHSSAEVLDLVLIDAHGQTTAIGVTASHPFWSADQQAFVPAGHLTPGTRLLTATVTC